MNPYGKIPGVNTLMLKVTGGERVHPARKVRTGNGTFSYRTVITSISIGAVALPIRSRNANRRVATLTVVEVAREKDAAKDADIVER